MERVYNFSAGPAALPLEVLQQAQAELLNWQNLGYSVMEVSHRTPMFQDVVDESESLLRELLKVPEDYRILFLSSSARAQFSAIPMNLLGSNQDVDFLITGFWSKVASIEAQKYGNVNVVAEYQESDLLTIPPIETWQLNPKAQYFYYTGNETIEGIEFFQPPNVNDVPLVCDMTSNFLAYPIDISRFGLIFAGCQKNAGIAGLTIVIVRKDLVDQQAIVPLVFDYKKQIQLNSLLVTPPVFPWYITLLLLRWLKGQGGVSAMEKINHQKSTMLYDIIDNNPIYQSKVDQSCRSRMNITFNLPTPEDELKFLNLAEQKNLYFLKGHAVKGGIRASIYNGVSLEAVKALAAFMSSFKL